VSKVKFEQIIDITGSAIDDGKTGQPDGARKIVARDVPRSEIENTINRLLRVTRGQIYTALASGQVVQIGDAFFRMKPNG
jgi:hypothetical protein